MKNFADYDAARQEERWHHVAELNAHKEKAMKRALTCDPFTAAKLDTADRIASALSVNTGQAQWIYFVVESGSGAIKIGVTTNVKKRVISLQRDTPHTVKLLATMRGNFQVESLLHRLFAYARIRGEWFRPVPELLEYIESLPQEAHLS